MSCGKRTLLCSASCHGMLCHARCTSLMTMPLLTTSQPWAAGTYTIFCSAINRFCVYIGQVDGKSSVTCYLMALDRCYASLCEKFERQRRRAASSSGSGPAGTSHIQDAAPYTCHSVLRSWLTAAAVTPRWSGETWCLAKGPCCILPVHVHLNFSVSCERGLGKRLVLVCLYHFSLLSKR